jgi:hypothetical protein
MFDSGPTTAEATDIDSLAWARPIVWTNCYRLMTITAAPMTAPIRAYFSAAM